MKDWQRELVKLRRNTKVWDAVLAYIEFRREAIKEQLTGCSPDEVRFIQGRYSEAGSLANDVEEWIEQVKNPEEFKEDDNPHKGY